jgi:hypothetical protein
MLDDPTAHFGGSGIPKTLRTAQAKVLIARNSAIIA